MRICITGRSHIAALKKALDDGKRAFQEHEIVFLGAPHNLYYEEVTIEGGTLRAFGKAAESFLMTSEGKYSRLDPDEFDAIVFYGCYRKPLAVFRSIISLGRENSDYMSAEFLRACAKSWLYEQATLDRIKAITERSKVQVYLMFEPFDSEQAKVRQHPEALVSQELRQIIYDGLAEATADVGATAIFQPDETIVDQVFTLHKFSVGSTRLSSKEEKHGNEDFSHMNDEYGAIALDHLMHNLEGRVN